MLGDLNGGESRTEKEEGAERGGCQEAAEATSCKIQKGHGKNFLDFYSNKSIH